MAYWFNVKSGQVEDDSNRGPDDHVMGPYDSADEAAKALQTAAEKTQRWDAEDAEWEDGGSA